MTEPTDQMLTSSANFLQNDYGQCFQQARYYDSQIADIFKYLATFYTTVATLAVGIFKLSVENGIDVRLALIIGLYIALLFGLLMFSLIIRNRIYFVICMRYINEQRAFFLATKPLGFENKTQMYTDIKQPHFFDKFSSQSVWYYAVAMLNSVLLGITLYLANTRTGLVIILSLVLFFGQLVVAISYLRSREHETAEEAVFGKNK